MQLSVIISVLLPLVAFFNIGDCAISAWTNPVHSNATEGDCGAIAGTIDDGTTASATTIAIVATGANSYTATVTPDGMIIVSANGSISFTGTIAYATAPQYVLVITATETTGNTTATCTATLSVNDQPAFSADKLSYCVSNGSAVDTAVATVMATNVVGTMEYSITSGNNNTDLGINGTTGAITAAKELTTANEAEYQIEYKGTDGTLDDTVTITITVGTCAGASAILASFMTIVLALFATLK